MPVVLLAGPDGSGKSTVAEEIGRLTPVTRREHFRPLRAPAPSASEPHIKPPRGMVTAVMKLAVLWLEQLYASPRRKRASRGGWVLIERGWWDAAVDPLRYRLPPWTSWLVRAGGRLLPKANVAVVLFADPVAINARKPELDIDEIERQIQEWRRVAPLSARRVVIIETSEWSSTQTTICALVRKEA